MKIVEGLESSAYHASPGVSCSLLKQYAVSAAHGRAMEDGLIRIGKEAREFGEAFHCATLEHKAYTDSYVVKPDGMSFATKEGKAWKAEQTRKIVSFDDWKAFDGMSASLQSHPVAGPFLRSKGRCELSLFDEIDGIPVRARFDKLTDGNVIVDLKTTVSARPFDFVRQCAYLRYFMQAAFYCDMLSRARLPMEGFVFLAVEKTPPYAVLCLEFDSISIDKGRTEYKRLLKLYEKCHAEKKWPSYYDAPIPYQATLPKWALEDQELPDQIVYELTSV